MHPSSLFHTDQPTARDIIRRNPLATLAANGADGPVIAIVPLVWDEDSVNLIGHVTRSNAFWKAFQDQCPRVSATFQAGDAYVSASAYPSKRDHARVVPTWNYIAAEARGRLTFQTNVSDVRASISALSDHMEAERDSPWAVSDAPDEFIDKLSRAIVAFQIDVTGLKGVRKLSQNKSEIDRDGVIADLSAQAGRRDDLIEEMRRTRQ